MDAERGNGSRRRPPNKLIHPVTANRGLVAAQDTDGAAFPRFAWTSAHSPRTQEPRFAPALALVKNGSTGGA